MHRKKLGKMSDHGVSFYGVQMVCELKQVLWKHCSISVTYVVQCCCVRGSTNRLLFKCLLL